MSEYLRWKSQMRINFQYCAGYVYRDRYFNFVIYVAVILRRFPFLSIAIRHYFLYSRWQQSVDKRQSHIYHRNSERTVYTCMEILLWMQTVQSKISRYYESGFALSMAITLLECIPSLHGRRPTNEVLSLSPSLLRVNFTEQQTRMNKNLNNATYQQFSLSWFLKPLEFFRNWERTTRNLYTRKTDCSW